MRGEFNLRTFLKSDLSRAHFLTSGGAAPRKGIRLWMGLVSPRFFPVLIYRLSFFFQIINLGVIAKIFTLINLIIFGIEISSKCFIGKGLYFPHTQGTVIGAWEMGEDVTIFQGVTLGAKEADFLYEQKYRPVVGNNVIVGAGAKVLGGVFIGDNSKIGANAVVLENIPENSIAVGIPAKILKNL